MAMPWLLVRKKDGIDRMLYQPEEKRRPHHAILGEVHNKKLSKITLEFITNDSIAKFNTLRTLTFQKQELQCFCFDRDRKAQTFMELAPFAVHIYTNE